MGYGFSHEDVVFLAGAAGAAALADVDRLELTPATHLRDLARVRRDHGDRAAALIETVRLRRRATAKLTDAGDWLFTDDALQQATPTVVARHRAARLAGRAVHDVTCSIGAELVELARVCPAVIGSDLDEVRLAMARHNLGGSARSVARPPAPAGRPGDDAVTARHVLLVKADALSPCTRDTVIIADPARRADGRRTHDPAKLQPPLPDLLAAYPGRDLAVKCAPGLDFDGLDWTGEIEVVSLDGSVREACLWSPGLTDSGVTRRATVLSSTGHTTALTDAEPDDIPERAPGEWIIDPDGAIVRAGLVRQYAAKHGLWQLDPRIAYLTGDRVPDGVRGFRVLDQLDFREKSLRSELRRRDCGAVEILVRGVDVDPDQLRRRLKPTGSQPYTLVITRIGRHATVFLCAALSAARAGTG
ncbi:class I SAM-dependent methyltransferase [Nocardia cyriacigeorgica]|uniref:class I SAM-dependent methyltransferase n=1 Tax=Nocardia cyriacigeorgica TaxID=135487 RepID=UPI001892D299|nr:class I SAM-dependent methyltransferase [Nocardia cyriacigeorgica]MBF6089430.1 class I SAM-dependent methyltransferase [Nocardia cyriacigeorgica]MBF6158862.1 class I SAM-dependent methyltransferase [Nocardia cyriacigeorgica]MBF6197452.1 class I SAM-dependent methyltransferase [Nocardia cyriacigeorgica]MBF6345148.1 class I SAM-dependent methyltransferase [Nocardia cyriacigeorgica]